MAASDEQVDQLISVAEAIEILDSAPIFPRVVNLPLHEAHHHVLADDLRADRDYPPFDKSLMDGFAVRRADVANAPVELHIAGEIPAGHEPPASPLASGECLAIMTGARMPPGADAVVPVEQTERISPQRVRILSPAVPARYIARAGADTRAGDVVLERGVELTSAQIAVAATIGAATVPVFARPRVAVLGTGDELVPLHAQPTSIQIRNSNNPMLCALLEDLHCEVHNLGTVRDAPGMIRTAIEQGLTFDALFVTGGMSMGEYDFVPRTLIDLGVHLRITKLKIKPGKPFVFGQCAGPTLCHVFGLPGNPVSAFVCTTRLASRIIQRLRGLHPGERWANAPVLTDLHANGPREFYQPAVVSAQGVRPLAWKGSADLFTLARAHALIIREENAPPVPAGTAIRILLL
jgi:molybdopterin molybdotransferase